MSVPSILRAVANRLTSTPIEDLPSQVGYLATSISSCRVLLQNGTSNNDHGTLIHKLKTRVSALLQDRTPEGRFCGIVIAKAMVEAGGSSILLDSGNWVRAIISCLGKSDSADVKKLGVLVIAHIYLSTAENQQLVREITTPTLPAFISTTLSIIKPSIANIEGRTVRALSPLLDVVLRSWDALLEHFPSTIRPSAASLRSICLSLVSDEACSVDTREAACRVLAKLHYCAPKNTTGTEWTQSCSQIISAVHDTADLTFRAINEDWTSVTNRVSKVTKKQKSASVPSTTNIDSAGLDPWSGVSQGCSRIQSQLDLLQHFLTTSHSSEVNMPLWSLFDLTARLSAITIPTSKYSPRPNNDITREERDELWLNLPRIHVGVLELYQAIVSMFGQALYPVCSIISAQIWDILEAEQASDSIRASLYQLVVSMLESRLIHFSKANSANVRLLVKCCCGDLSLTSSTPTSQISLTNGNSGTTAQNDKSRTSGDLQQPKWSKATITRHNTELYTQAYRLLPVLITYGDLHLLEGSSTIRAQLDSTAILLNHHEAILASVLNPPGSSASPKTGAKKAATPSLIPFLARSTESNGVRSMSNIERLGYEAMLRPRMPVVRTTVNDANGQLNDEQDEGDSVVDEEDIVMLDEDDQPEQVRAADTQTDTENAGSSKSTQPASQVFADLASQTNSTKRDFTTLLEQSANEQLAASARDDDTSFQSTKRARTTNQDNEAYTHTQSNILTSTSSIDPGSLPPTTDRLGVSNTDTDTDTAAVYQQPVTFSSTMQGKVEHDDDESSSDSDVPLIDATLVGISDSEDEDDDEQA